MILEGFTKEALEHLFVEIKKSEAIGNIKKNIIQPSFIKIYKYFYKYIISFYLLIIFLLVFSIILIILVIKLINKVGEINNTIKDIYLENLTK
jgi:hypothetical protein